MLRTFRLLLVAILAITTVLSGVPPQRAEAEGPIKVEYSVDPQSPEATREARIRVRLSGAGDQVIDDARVLFTADMSHSASGAPGSHAAIRKSGKKESQPGEYIVNVTFSMPGTWTAKIEAETPTGKQAESFTIEVAEQKTFTGVNWPIVGGALVVLALIFALPAVLKARNKGQLADQDDED